MKSLDEATILAQLQRAETRHKAFEQIVQTYSEQLYWQIRRMVLSHEDANDILQNAFIKAWKNILSFRGDSLLSTWLYRIAYNETLNFLERQHTVDSVGIDSAIGATVVQIEGDAWFDGNEAERLLQKAIQSLPPKQREVFNMKYFQEMKYEEMSEILGTSQGALKASYHLAVKKYILFWRSTFRIGLNNLFITPIQEIIKRPQRKNSIEKKKNNQFLKPYYRTSVKRTRKEKSHERRTRHHQKMW